jgi:Sporulation and spore germination/Lipoprotein LpqB beta-propeller domain
VADRRVVGVLLTLVTTLSLAACTTGVPPSDRVVVVSPVPPAQQSRESSGPGSGPRPGLSEAQVAQGFMRAMATGDPDRTLPWIVPDKSARAQVEGWKGGHAASVYHGEFQPQAATDDRGQKVVGVRLQLVGTIDGQRWVPDSRQVNIQLRLRQVGGEWRVANPDRAPWIDDTNFKQLCGPVDLFLVAADRQHLAPVQIFLPRPATGTPQVTALEMRAAAAMRALLVEPEGLVSRTLASAIPEGTKLRRLHYMDNLVTVDLSGEFAEPSGGPGALRLGQVVWTLTRLIPTATVRLTVEGRPATALGPDRFDADRAWRRTTPPLGDLFTGLWPHRAGSPMRLAFARNGELYTTELIPGTRPTVLPYNATGQKLAPTWASHGDRLAFLLLGDGGQRSLWIGSGDGSAVRSSGVRGQLSPPSWLPDASKLLVMRRSGDQVELLGVTPGVQQASRLTLAPMPGGLRPTVLRVSPDGAFVLGVGGGRQAKFGDGGLLFLGLLSPSGVVAWFPRPIAPGLGEVFSPVWVDTSTIAFIGKTGNKDDLGKLWIMDPDGWDPTPLLNLDPSSENAVDIGDELTVDPTGNRFIFVVQSEDGTSLWMIDRLGASLRQLTSPGGNGFDNEPSFATR